MILTRIKSDEIKMKREHSLRKKDAVFKDRFDLVSPRIAKEQKYFSKRTLTYI